MFSADPLVRILFDPEEKIAHWTEFDVGGHFPGSTVARYTAPDGKGVLLAGDAVFPNDDGQSVSFMRSYPNLIPLSAAVVRRLADQVTGLEIDRLYNNFRARVPERAGEVVELSARRYIEWVSGTHDHRT